MGSGQLCRQTASTEQLYKQFVVSNTADRGSGVGQTSPKLMTKGRGGRGGGGLPCPLYSTLLYAVSYASPSPGIAFQQCSTLHTACTTKLCQANTELTVALLIFQRIQHAYSYTSPETGWLIGMWGPQLGHQDPEKFRNIRVISTVYCK